MFIKGDFNNLDDKDDVNSINAVIDIIETPADKNNN